MSIQQDERRCEICGDPEGPNDIHLQCRYQAAGMQPSIIEPPPDFPLWAFPPPLANFVTTVATAIAAPLAFSAASVFPIAATALGERRTLVIDPRSDWRAPSIIWVALVGETGEAKSPVLKQMMKPLFALDSDSRQIYEVELEHWQGINESERKKQNLRMPRMAPWLRTDVTIEQLSNDLKAHRSILAFFDELTEWVSTIKKGTYGNSVPARPKWLHLFDGERFDRVRVGGERESVDICILDPRVSLLGGIQPRMLGELCDRSDGLEHRILFAYAKEDRSRRRSGEIEDAAWWGAAVRKMARLTTRDVPMRPEGLAMFEDFKDEMYAMRWDNDNVPKLHGYCARIANVLAHLWMHYEGEERDVLACDVERAIEVSKWFYYQREQIEPELTPEYMESRITRLSLEKLKDYLQRKCDAYGVVEWRAILQAKVPGITTTADLSKAVATLEALEIARETIKGKKRCIQLIGANNG